MTTQQHNALAGGGNFSEPAETNLQSALETYLRYHRMEGHTRTTVLSSRYQLGIFCRWVEEKGYPTDPTLITPDHIMQHLEWMRERGLAPTSVNTRFRELRAWFNWMTRWKMVPAAPTAVLNAPRAPRVSKPFITKDEFNTMLRYCDQDTLIGSRRVAILWMLITTGMRRNELIQLRWEDLDFDKNIVRVVHGKGQKERWVALTVAVRRALQPYLIWRGIGGGPLWITSYGKPLTHEGVGRDMIRLAERAGVKLVDPCHIFRRTFAAEAVKQGIPRPYVQAMAGWATPNMLDRYIAWMQREEEAITYFRTFTPYQGGTV